MGQKPPQRKQEQTRRQGHQGKEKGLLKIAPFHRVFFPLLRSFFSFIKCFNGIYNVPEPSSRNLWDT